MVKRECSCELALSYLAFFRADTSTCAFVTSPSLVSIDVIFYLRSFARRPKKRY